MNMEDLRNSAYEMAGTVIDAVFDFLEDLFEPREKVDFPSPFGE